MATTDSNGLVRIDGSDSIQPLHPVLNAITQSVSDAFNQTTRIYPVSSLAARTALFERVGASPDRPLMVWYSMGATGRQLMYTRGGNGESNWKYYSSSEDTAASHIWRVANVTGRTNIFNSVGPGTTANPVMVWRADAPVGQQLEYNVTSNNAVANWHSYSSSQVKPVHVNMPVISPLTSGKGVDFYLYPTGLVQVMGEVTASMIISDHSYRPVVKYPDARFFPAIFTRDFQVSYANSGGFGWVFEWTANNTNGVRMALHGATSLSAGNTSYVNSTYMSAS